jgi:hypothetical protein
MAGAEELTIASMIQNKDDIDPGCRLEMTDATIGLVPTVAP